MHNSRLGVNRFGRRSVYEQRDIRTDERLELVNCVTDGTTGMLFSSPFVNMPIRKVVDFLCETYNCVDGKWPLLVGTQHASSQTDKIRTWTCYQQSDSQIMPTDWYVHFSLYKQFTRETDWRSWVSQRWCLHKNSARSIPLPHPTVGHFSV